MQTILADRKRLNAWIELRQKLWGGDKDSYQDEAIETLASDDQTCFLIQNDTLQVVGFIEGAIYTNHTPTYAHVEGWYVLPEYQGRGYGGELIAALEQWMLHRAIALVLSDTIPKAYPLSTKAHHASGYEELMEIKVFVKKLQPEVET